MECVHRDPATTPEAVAFYEAAADLFCALAARWQDEHKYEDIQDYAKPLTPIAKQAGVKIDSMTKRPFGCLFSVCNRKFHLFIKGRRYQYKRIA